MSAIRQSARELPSRGGRVTAWRSPGLPTAPGADVHYDVELCTAAGRWTLEARIGEGTELVLSACEAPVWLADYLRALMKGLSRQHREDGRWPRRITRWRGEPEGSR